MSYLPYVLTLSFGQHKEIVCKRSERVVRRSRHDNTALETIRIIVHYSIECIGSAAHHNVPQKMFDMNIHASALLASRS